MEGSKKSYINEQFSGVQKGIQIKIQVRIFLFKTVEKKFI
jgi:hypothetical protein